MSDDWSDLDELNMTELVEMAWFANPGAHRGLPRSVLIDIIKGADVDLPVRQIDVWRGKLFTFCDTHWTQVKPFLSCPMKTRKPNACFNCLDAQVAECTLTNYVSLTKKPESKSK